MSLDVVWSQEEKAEKWPRGAWWEHARGEMRSAVMFPCSLHLAQMYHEKPVGEMPEHGQPKL